MYDAVIIGAGIVGAMTARELMKYNLKLCILEKENDAAMGATKANSAIVHAGFDAKPHTLKAKLNVRGSKMMKRVCEELGVKYKNNGSIVMGKTADDEKIIHTLYEQGKENGVSELYIINRQELKSLEPNVCDDYALALYAKSGSIVCPYELCIAAIGNAMDNGADLKLNFNVTDIKEKDGYFEIISPAETVKAKFVINAAGVYSDKISKYVCAPSFKIHPRRGEYILLDKACDIIPEHTVFTTPTKMGKGILVSPTVDGNFLIGPTSFDISDKENTKTTLDGILKLKEQANAMFKNIPYGKMITSFCGLRAVGDTGDFIINSPKKGFINAAAIESPGLSASPAIAEMIADMLKSQGLIMTENKNFNPIRKPSHYFKDAPLSEKNKMIKENPSYGKIICRCEKISEGEIVDAIRQNPCARDIDGIKRRTRSGMGRCQGGFCMPYVAEILSRELGVPLEEITKCGVGSEIITGRTKGAK